MTCNGCYRNDRVCELCELSNREEFKTCKQKYIDKITLDKKLKKIYNKCPFRYEGGYGYDAYDECRRQNIYCSCSPSIECEKYITK